MYEFLISIDAVTWIPIVISIISLISTIIFNIYSNKRLKQAEKHNEKNFNWRKNFEIYKEENRKKDNLIQNLMSNQNIRASIIPYFNVVLRDDRIQKEENSLILEVGFVNIGKESATNIQLCPKDSDKGLGEYFYSEGYPEKQYCIYEYLSQYYAVAKEEVSFKIKVHWENREIINDFLKIKIKYSDLIGNQYVQEFRFGVYASDHKVFYNLNNTSYKPIELKK